MVFSRNSSLKKKPTLEDLKAWRDFTSSKQPVENKDLYLEKKKLFIENFRKVDLHGFSLNAANKKIEQIIDKCSEEGVKKILVITGKGLRSKTKNNPYISEDLSILKNSVPEFVRSSSNLMKIIKHIKDASVEDGGEGAFYIYLKKFKE